MQLTATLLIATLACFAHNASPVGAGTGKKGGFVHSVKSKPHTQQHHHHHHHHHHHQDRHTSPKHHRHHKSNGAAVPTRAIQPSHVAVPTTTQSTARASPTTISTANTSGLSADIQAWLNAHNTVRAEYGVPAVTWSDALVPTAQKETDSCVFQHTSNNEFGENIAAGQTTIQSVVDDWVNGSNEKSAYDPANPIFSHFTQVVWASTTEIGCAQTTCTNGVAGLPQANPIFWACEYNPPGNVQGEFLANVKAARGGAPL